MKNKKDKFFNKGGFTLVEMLLAIAILMVVSGAILVSISSQREKARTTRMLSEISGSIQSIYLCVSDEGNVSAPSSEANICSLSSAYGHWPELQTDFSYSSGGSFDDNSWYISIASSDSEICCNPNISGCEVLENVGDTCNSSTP